MKLRVLLSVVVLAWSAPAWGQRGPGGRAGEFTKGKRVLQRGNIKSLRSKRVRIAGRKEMTIGAIADEAFADQRAFQAEIGRARGGLRAAPVIEDEVVETDDAVVITQSTSYTVVDPGEVRRKSPRFGKMRKPMKARGTWSVSKLDATQRAEFNAWREQVKGYPADHPLRIAAEKGDDALVDAVIEGKGDFEVTETLIIPKVDIVRDASGRVLAPRVGSDGRMDFGSTAPVRASFSATVPGGPGREVDVESPPSKTKRKGKVKHTAQFLAGFTEEDAFEWNKHFKFPSGHLDVTFNAWYAFGLRIPIEVKGTIDPAGIHTTGGSGGVEPFSVVLSAKTMDADAQFYRDVGLDAGDVLDGKEFVLTAGFDVVVDVKAGWVIKGRWRIPKGGAQIDWGQHFVPPHGNCGTGCGPELWVPAEITRTTIGLLGIVKGSARAGFKLTGDGDVKVDYEALYGKDTVVSWHPGKKTEARRQRTLSFDRRGQEMTLKAETQPINRAGASKRYGYRLSEPRYTWKVVAVPGVRADIDVNAWPIIDDSFPIGPKWFDSLAIDLGTLKLPHHKGTKKAYKVKEGERTLSN